MPFSSTESKTEKDWKRIFDTIFKPAWEEGREIVCERAVIQRGSIPKSIIESLYFSDIVFADLTDSNISVYYELGIRNTLRKPTMMVRQAGFSINKTSIYLNHDMIHIYEDSLPGGKDNLRTEIDEFLKDLNNNPTKPDNYVWEFLHIGGAIWDYYRNKENIRKLSAWDDEININIGNLKGLLRKRINGEIQLKTIGVHLSAIRMDCMMLYITTRYVEFQDKLITDKALNDCQYLNTYLQVMKQPHSKIANPKQIIDEVEVAIGNLLTLRDKVHNKIIELSE